MKKLLPLFFLFFSLSAFSQNPEYYVKTDIESARYEIIQSPMARRYTIKIDKRTGNTWLLVKDANDNDSWEKLTKNATTAADTKVDGKNNYIIFMGGIAARDMYLLNINTGACWQLVQNSYGGYVWDAMTTY